MSNGQKEFMLLVRDAKGKWTLVEEVVNGVSQPAEYRTESAAQREGSLKLKDQDQKIDAFKVLKTMALHHPAGH